MKKMYAEFEQLPFMLNADQVSQILGISRAGTYQIMHSKGFPTVKLGKRMVVPKDKLFIWIEERLHDNGCGVTHL